MHVTGGRDVESAVGLWLAIHLIGRGMPSTTTVFWRIGPIFRSASRDRMVIRASFARRDNVP